MITADPEWNDNERRAYGADWNAWVEFAGSARALPADPAVAAKFIEEQVEDVSEAIAQRRKRVIQRIHELNDLADPFAGVLPDDHLVWRLLANDGYDEDIGFVARKLTDEQWAAIEKGTIGKGLRSLCLNGIEIPEIQRWYDWVNDARPSLSSLQLGDNFYPAHDLGDPTTAIGAVSASLRTLHVCGTFHLQRPVKLRLNDLYLKGYATVSPAWFDESSISAGGVHLELDELDAARYASIVMHPEADAIEISGATNIAALLAELFTRPKAPSYLEVRSDSLSGGALAFEALINATPSWKRTVITLPYDLLDAGMIDELDDAGFSVTED